MSPAAVLTVLTGETGAGKTALLSALKLLMGERADASSVREGEAGLVVEGRFFKGADDPEVSVLSVAYLPMVAAASNRWFHLKRPRARDARWLHDRPVRPA